MPTFGRHGGASPTLLRKPLRLLPRRGWIQQPRVSVSDTLGTEIVSGTLGTQIAAYSPIPTRSSRNAYSIDVTL